MRRRLLLALLASALAVGFTVPLSLPASADITGSISASPLTIASGSSSTITASFLIGPPAVGNTHVVGIEIAPVGAVTGTATLSFSSATGGVTCSNDASGNLSCPFPGGGGNGDSTTVTASMNTSANAVGTWRMTAVWQDHNTGRTVVGTVDVTVEAPPPSADLSITKSDAPDPVVSGQALTYTLNYANAGPDTAIGVEVFETLPAGVSLVSATPDQGSCTSGAGVTCSLGNLASGASGQITIVVNVNAAAGAVLTNQAFIQGVSPTDLNAANNSTSATTDVVAPPSADLSITKSDSPDPVVSGQNLSYTLSYANAGPDSAVDVQVVDTLPAGVTFVTATPDQGSCSGTGPITCDLGDLTSGASGQVTIMVTVNAVSGSTLTNQASVQANGGPTDPNAANNSASATTDVAAPSADLSITKTDAPDPVLPGADITYTLTYLNDGPNDATGVTVLDVLPPQLSLVSATPDVGSCLELVTNVIQCDLGTVTSGAGGSITIIATVDGATPGMTIANGSSINAITSDPDDANNTASAETTVTSTADLSITKSDSPDPVLPGATLTYTLTYQNDGPSAATGVSIIDVLPAEVTFDSATPDQGTCGEAAGVVTCDIGALAVGGSGQVEIVVTVSGAAVPGSTITNNTAINSITEDPSNSNNTASVVTTIEDESDLSITKSDSPDPVTAGGQLTYTITYDNLGPSDATGVVVTDVLPTGVTLVSLTPDQGSCDVLGGTITCNVGGVAVADPAGEIVVVVDIDPSTPGGTITNTSSVTGDQVDPNTDNNSTSEDTTVTTSADVSLTKSDAPDPVVAGEQLTYTLVYANAGPSDAQDVSVVDALPAGVTFVSANPDQGSCSESGGTVTCELGTLLAGASGQIVVVVDVDPSTIGTITNLATANPGTADPNFTNNSVSVDTTIEASADLSLTKTASPLAVDPGNTVTYTLTFSNAGPSTASDVVVSDSLPSPLTFVSATPSSGTCSEAAGTVTCNVGDVEPGSGGTVVVVASLPAGASPGVVANSASVSSTTTDPTPSDNLAVAAFQVNPEPGATTTTTTPAATTTTTVAAVDNLPLTGSSIRLLAVFGLVALLSGLLVIGRRRSETD